MSSGLEIRSASNGKTSDNYSPAELQNHNRICIGSMSAEEPLSSTSSSRHGNCISMPRERSINKSVPSALISYHQLSSYEDKDLPQRHTTSIFLSITSALAPWHLYPKHGVTGFRLPPNSKENMKQVSQTDHPANSEALRDLILPTYFLRLRSLPL